MSRRDFSVAVKRAAYERSRGICECGCNRPFTDHPKERPEYDHELCDFLDGKPDLENCKVIRVDCHLIKTARDMKHIKKARRGEKARKNITRAKHTMPGSKASGWKKPINGPAYRRIKP